MAGRKVFTSGEILTAADVNSFLMDQSVMVFADSSARSSAIPSPSEGMLTYLQDTDAVEKYTTAWESVDTGGLIAVVEGQLTTVASFSHGSGAVTQVSGLSASITPKSPDNKIIVQVSLQGSSSGAEQTILVKRDSTPVGVPPTVGDRTSVSGSAIRGDGTSTGSDLSNATALIVDSPSTTSELTYTVFVHNTRASSSTVYINRSKKDNNGAKFPRGLSKIVLMEVAV